MNHRFVMYERDIWVAMGHKHGDHCARFAQPKWDASLAFVVTRRHEIAQQVVREETKWPRVTESGCNQRSDCHDR